MDDQECQGPFRQVKPLILASKSPRRRALLGGLGLTFEVLPSSLEEPPRREGEPPHEYALRLAYLKARGVWENNRDKWVLGADTVVVLDGEIIGKPDGPAHAINMLKRLRGKCHTVHTGCSLLGPEGLEAQVDERLVLTSRVWLSHIGDELIRAYVATGEPLDKAGSYAIQGRGAFMVERIEGSYTNVVGLPLKEVVDLLLRYRVVMPLE